ncbi:hypothetical protein D3C86_828340 [compost metagenome]
MLAHRTVKAAQEQFAAIQQRGLGTQAMEDPGELDRNVATAHHQHPLGQLFEEERLVGTDGMLVPRNLRNLRPAAGSDQDVFGAKALAIDLDLMRVDDLRVTFMQGHATVDQQVAINAIEAIDLAVLVGDQRRPVELRLIQAPAKTGSLLEVFGEVRTVDQQFFRHAADVHTGPAQVAAFGHGHFRTEPGGKPRSPHTAGTGTNHIKVKIVGHFQSPRQVTSIPIDTSGASAAVDMRPKNENTTRAIRPLA